MISGHFSGLGINRTTVELKRGNIVRIDVSFRRINRTTVELKLIKLASLYNVTNGINRTTVELKLPTSLF